jgi:para-aminobenzoate synthetase component 1
VTDTFADLDQHDYAHVGGLLARDLVEIRHDVEGLDDAGFWVVVMGFEGEVTCARFGDVRPAALPTAPWFGPRRDDWVSSLDRMSYCKAVEEVRELIARGEVYQVNVCRVLSAPTNVTSLRGLAAVLAIQHPSRYPALVHLPSAGVFVCSASPELYLSRDRVDGFDVVETRPIKGTGRQRHDITDKDRAENVMIVDMARNDLGRVARTGSVDVPSLCEFEEYPGLVHLVSTVRAKLVRGATWAQILSATYPPASVSGAPKLRALQVIRELEPTARGPYCGAVGWIDADRTRASLAVGIRTFWLDAGQLRFGSGAGITWGSNAEAEWAETELKAELLLAAASTDN